jgi:hypothetical protein
VIDGTAYPGEDDVYVGARKRLDDERRHGEIGQIVVDYYDASIPGEEQWRTVAFCADGARKLARELNVWAKTIESAGTAKRVR